MAPEHSDKAVWDAIDSLRGQFGDMRERQTRTEEAVRALTASVTALTTQVQLLTTTIATATGGLRVGTMLARWMIPLASGIAGFFASHFWPRP